MTLNVCTWKSKVKFLIYFLPSLTLIDVRVGLSSELFGYRSAFDAPTV